LGYVKDPEGAEASVLGRTADFTGARVLEVGCGDGRLTRLYAAEAASVLAIDTKADEIATARRETHDDLRARVAFRVQSAIDLDEPPAAFDTVFFSWSF
jgi:2-polyprenyl-3-methyl-5-hydroxy-6-metoxy-1,4-benzoquinol methylase